MSCGETALPHPDLRQPDVGSIHVHNRLHGYEGGNYLKEDWGISLRPAMACAEVILTLRGRRGTLHKVKE